MQLVISFKYLIFLFSGKMLDENFLMIFFDVSAMIFSWQNDVHVAFICNRCYTRSRWWWPVWSVWSLTKSLKFKLCELFYFYYIFSLRLTSFLLSFHHSYCVVTISFRLNNNIYLIERLTNYLRILKTINIWNFDSLWKMVGFINLLFF